jgi:hypothetical protein
MAAAGGNGGLLASVSEKLIRALPPAFLLLVLLNIVFLGVATWVFGHNTESRNALLTKIIDKCLLQTERSP